MTLSNLAICTSPQHLMNLAQAQLAGLVTEPVKCLVLEHSEAGSTYGNDVLRGTLELVGKLCPGFSIRHIVLRPPVSNIRIAQLARKTRVGTSQTLLLGVYPSPLWARSPALASARQVVLLDDGASSLTLDLGRIFNGHMTDTRHRLYAQMLEGATGTVRQSRAVPIVYTCFPVQVTGGSVVRHQYGELRTALLGQGATMGLEPPGSRIWIDSNYSWLSPRAHLDLVAAAVDQFGVDAYVPHRRTDRDLSATICRELGLAMVRPDLPLELLIGGWTRQGVVLITPPTSLVHTSGLFRESPGEVVIVNTSHWLRSRAIGASAGEFKGLVTAIDHATVVEQSIQPAEAFRVFTLG